MDKVNKQSDEDESMILKKRWIKKMEVYAQDHYVPIIRKENIGYLNQLIREHEIFTVLEIGTAIGYSAIRMALENRKLVVDTIERDLKLIEVAKINIKKVGLSNRIQIIEGDALEVEIKKSYDLIFIDAAKAQYQKFFEKYEVLLNAKGIIVSDNLDLIDLQKQTNSKKSKKIVEKMANYKLYLQSLQSYTTEFIAIGDGFAITKKNSSTI